jgi:hypothetical protein
MDAGMVKDDYVLEYDWQGTDQVSWRLVRSQMQKSQHGSYVLDPTATGPSSLPPTS